MKFLRFLLLSGLISTASVTVAHAEQGCPDGFMPNPVWTQGQQYCIPSGTPSGSGYAAPQPSEPRWAKRWGAIAYDPDTGKVGVANDMKSKRKAVSFALDSCRSKGGRACAVNIDYSNQCAVFVYGGEGEYVSHASSSAATEEEAAGRALSTCKQSAGVDCQVFYSGCTYPERVQ